MYIKFHPTTYNTKRQTAPQVASHILNPKLRRARTHREFFAWTQLRSRNKETNKKFKPAAKISTWFFVSVFYALLFSPALFHLQGLTTLPALAKTGWRRILSRKPKPKPKPKPNPKPKPKHSKPDPRPSTIGPIP